jgi:nucleoside-diphosphate-sugar epimerase
MAARAAPGLTAVTGASGFLGRHVVSELARRGERVRILLRTPAACPPWADCAPEVVEGDLSPASLRRLVAGADAVIHCAGLISARSYAEFDAVNHRGAEAAAEATRAAAPRARFVLVSSLAAREPGLSSYALSKRSGEAKVRALLREDRTLVVRPPAIYGPGDRATLPLFRMAAKRSWAPMVRPKGGRLALIHVEDAACAIADLAFSDASGIVTLGGDRPEGYEWRELVLALFEASGRPRPRMVRIPAPLIRAAGALTGLASQLTRRPAVFSPGKANELLHRDWSVSAREMGRLPQPIRYPLREGLAQTAGWYREQGWL